MRKRHGRPYFATKFKDERTFWYVASFNVDGELFEMDVERPDVRMVLPIDSYFVRARWYLENVLLDIATYLDALALKQAKENCNQQCTPEF